MLLLSPFKFLMLLLLLLRLHFYSCVMTMVGPRAAAAAAAKRHSSSLFPHTTHKRFSASKRIHDDAPLAESTFYLLN